MGDWIIGWTTGAVADGPLPALVCLPPAGAGCRRFGSWQHPLAGTAEVFGVQLPGREDRWHEPMPDTFDQAVDTIVTALTRRLGRSRPLVLYGHSFGGLLAYEVARRTTPYALVVSGCRAPARAPGTGRRTAGSPVREDELDRLLDTDDPGLDPGQAHGLRDLELRELALEMLRKDAALSRSYTHRPEPRLRVPVHVWGADDDATVTPAELDRWAAATTGPLHRRQVPGGHHAVLRRPQQLLAHLAELLRAAAAAPAPAGLTTAATAAVSAARHTGA
ncbi:thioesterase II family protein [Streptomyces sp. NPDC000229]|uniref:thioesterase II family protein n=1 Tax=Streptomyces sp. NPDC000229 TaxID=3154247 RepID=UPI003329B0D9